MTDKTGGRCSEALGGRPAPGDAAHGDVDEDQGQSNGEQAVPDRLGGGADFQTVAAEEIGGGGIERGQDPAARALGDLVEKAVIAAEIAEFGGAVDAGAGEEDAAFSVLAGVIQVADVAPLLAGVEIGFVGSGARLKQAHGMGREVSAAGDGAGDIQEIVEGVSFLLGMDGDVAFVAVGGHVDFKITGDGGAGNAADDLRPEFVVKVAVDPVGVPAIEGIGGVDGDFSETGLPLGEQWIGF